MRSGFFSPSPSLTLPPPPGPKSARRAARRTASRQDRRLRLRAPKRTELGWREEGGGSHLQHEFVRREVRRRGLLGEGGAEGQDALAALQTRRRSAGMGGRGDHMHTQEGPWSAWGQWRPGARRGAAVAGALLRGPRNWCRSVNEVAATYADAGEENLVALGRDDLERHGVGHGLLLLGDLRILHGDLTRGPLLMM